MEGMLDLGIESNVIVSSIHLLDKQSIFQVLLVRSSRLGPYLSRVNDEKRTNGSSSSRNKGDDTIAACAADVCEEDTPPSLFLPKHRMNFADADSSATAAAVAGKGGGAAAAALARAILSELRGQTTFNVAMMEVHEEICSPSNSLTRELSQAKALIKLEHMKSKSSCLCKSFNGISFVPSALLPLVSALFLLIAKSGTTAPLSPPLLRPALPALS